MRNGQPYEHPVMEENMRQLFPEHDLAIAPDGFSHFTRVPQPVLGVYEKIDSSYESDGVGGFKDVWHTIPLSDEEKTEKIAVTKQNSPYPSWIFVEETCTMNPPVEYPEDGKRYQWDEEETNWIMT